MRDEEKRVGRVEKKKQVMRQKNLVENRVVCFGPERIPKKNEENSGVGEITITRRKTAQPSP
jgi:hypothetical protein